MFLTVCTIRLSTVRNSQAIMVLEQGEIIERGSHEQLIEQKGKYYQLYTGAFDKAHIVLNKFFLCLFITCAGKF